MKRLRGVVGPVVLVAAVVALVLALRGQGDEARDALGRTGLSALIGAGAAVLVGLLCCAQLWRVLLRELGTTLTQRQAWHVFFVGQLGKYVPGTVFAMAAQMQVGRRYRVPGTRMATAWLLFMAVLVATALLVAGLALPLAGPGTVVTQGAPGGYAWLLPVGLVGLVGLLPPVLTRLVGLVLRATRRPPLPRPLSWSGIGAAGGWALATWAAYAVHLVLLVQPQDPVTAPRLALLALGAFALAWSAGPLSVVAPAGAGVREAVLVVALAPVLAAPAALAVALTSRLLMLLGDAVWAGVGVLLRQPALPTATGSLLPVRGR